MVALLASLMACLSIGFAAGAATPSAPSSTNSVAYAGTASLSPVLDYLYNGPNQDNLTVLSQAIQAAALESYFNQTKLSITLFAPTDAAFLKRFGVIESALNITQADIFSFKKQFVLSAVLTYHVIQFAIEYSDLKDGEQFATLSNLCSNSKDLSASRVGNVVTMDSAGRINATIIGQQGVDVTQSATSTVKSSIYFIDDVLLPEVVTIPLSVAFSQFISGQGAPDATSGRRRILEALGAPEF